MLKASGICKRYSRHTVLRNATLCLEGEIKALIGINGSGKSTFLKVIAGIVQADSGEVFINGENVTKLYPEHRNVGYVPQYPALFQHLNVEENILYGIRKNKTVSPINKMAAKLRFIFFFSERYFICPLNSA